MNSDNIEEKYLMAERGRQYLLMKVEDMEKQIDELVAIIDEMQNKNKALLEKIRQSQQEREQWQQAYYRT